MGKRSERRRLARTRICVLCTDEIPLWIDAQLVMCTDGKPHPVCEVCEVNEADSLEFVGRLSAEA